MPKPPLSDLPSAMTTLIIGGGLSGLALADMLHRRGHEFRLLEARDRLGGRILTEQLGDASFDMGPAWFWPGQPRMAALIDRLGLETFEQYAEGLLAVEDAQGQVQHGRAHAAMQGSLRVGGGLAAVTHALAEALPPDLIRCGAQVAYLARAEGTITATLTTGEPLQAERVVLAMPPRIAATLDYIPALPAASLEAMRGVSTWMAGQAKALAVYEAPFWREAGLSGDAMSRHGPMVEIHDASPMHGGPYGLFGFIGVPAEARTDHDTLRAAVIAQLVRLFGPQAATPSLVFL